MGAIITVEPQVVVFADVTGLGHRFGANLAAGLLDRPLRANFKFCRLRPV